MFGKGIQKRVTKLVPRLKHMSYATRLAELKTTNTDIQTKKSRYDASLYRLSGMDNLDKTNSLSLMKTDRQEEFNLNSTSPGLKVILKLGCSQFEL